MFNLLAIPVAITLGGTTIALLDAISIVVLLIALIVGAIKGFIKQIFSILGWVVALILAISFADDLALFISEKIPAIPNAISSKINELFNIDGVLLGGTKEEILNLLSSTKIPEFLHEILADAIVQSTGKIDIAHVITDWAIIAISFVLIFVLCLIVIAIVKKLFSFLTKISIIGAIDRVLGAVFSALKAFLIIIILIVLASLIIDMNVFLKPVIDGVEIKCFLNEVISFITNLDFVKNLITF